MAPDTAATGPAQLRVGWHQINVGEPDADDWCFDLPQGHTIEIGPAGADYSVVYVVRGDGLQVSEELSLPHQPDRAAAMAAAEAIPVCRTCGLPIYETTERLTGWDHIAWDDEPHDVLPKDMTPDTAATGPAQSQAAREPYDPVTDAIASVRLEGVEVSPETVALLRRVQAGEMTADDVVAIIKARYEVRPDGT